MANPNQPEIDAARGIENATVRFERESRGRLLQEQLLASANDRRKKSNEKNWVSQMETETETPLSQKGASSQRSAITQTTSRGLSIKRMRAGLALVRGTHISILVWLAAFQFIFAIVAAMAYGMEAAKMAFCETTAGGLACSTVGVFTNVLDFFSDIDMGGLSFQLVGDGFSGLILLLTIFILIGTLLLLNLSGKGKEIYSPNNVLIAALCFTLNITPIINIMPWIEIWSGYMLIINSLPPLPGLSSASKRF